MARKCMMPGCTNHPCLRQPNVIAHELPRTLALTVCFSRRFVAPESIVVPCVPAPTPKQSNVLYFPTAAAASNAGYRPCLRCRPELSPGATWGGEDTVQRALSLIIDGALEEGSVETLAEKSRSQRTAIASPLSATFRRDTDYRAHDAAFIAGEAAIDGDCLAGDPSCIRIRLSKRAAIQCSVH